MGFKNTLIEGNKVTHSFISDPFQNRHGIFISQDCQLLQRKNNGPLEGGSYNPARKRWGFTSRSIYILLG